MNDRQDGRPTDEELQRTSCKNLRPASLGDLMSAPLSWREEANPFQSAGEWELLIEKPAGIY